MENTTNNEVQGNTDNAADENGNAQQQSSQAESATNLEDSEAGKVSGNSQNNGYGNTPGEDESVDPDTTKIED